MDVSADVADLFEALYPRLVVVLYATCGHQGDAEDAVQEAFTKALRNQRKFVSLDSPEAWLRTVALNHLRNGWRHHAVVRRLRSKVPGLQASFELGTDHVAIMAALAELERPQREVVVLHYLVDLSVAEIATTLGIAQGTVKSRLSRSRDRLAALLTEEEREDA
ncbi:MAG: RNA polymerase sigma factor [Nocardioides sp.]